MRAALVGWTLLGVMSAGMAWAQVDAAPTVQVPEATEGQRTPEEKAQRRFLRDISNKLWAADFAGVDAAAEQARVAKMRLPGGGWQIHAIYGVLSEPHGREMDWDAHLARLMQWIAKEPRSVTARVALAQGYKDYAWVARGDGQAEKMTPEGTVLFFARLAVARKVLDQARQAGLVDAEWYLVNLTVTLAQEMGRPLLDQAFREAVAAEPDYLYLYKDYANFILPKWDGKPGEAASFAAKSADSIGGQRGDELYFQIASTLLGRGNWNFEAKQLDWARIQRGAAGIEQSYGASNGERNEMARMATKFGDVGVAKVEFAQIGDRWSASVWKNQRQFDRAREAAGVAGN